MCIDWGLGNCSVWFIKSLWLWECHFELTVREMVALPRSSEVMISCERWVVEGKSASPAIITLKKNGSWKLYWLSARIILHCFPHQFSNSLKVEGQPIVRAIPTLFVSVASRCHTSTVSKVIGKNYIVNIRCTQRNKYNQLAHFWFYRVHSGPASGIFRAGWWAAFWWKKHLFGIFLQTGEANLHGNLLYSIPSIICNGVEPCF